jgi:hypothetical protein
MNSPEAKPTADVAANDWGFAQKLGLMPASGTLLGLGGTWGKALILKVWARHRFWGVHPMADKRPIAYRWSHESPRVSRPRQENSGGQNEARSSRSYGHHRPHHQDHDTFGNAAREQALKVILSNN